jgi:hypothetical protein
MSRLQIIVIAISCLFFLGLYFGGETKPQAQETVEKTRALTAKSTSIESILSEAKASLSKDTAAIIGSIEKALSESTTDSTKVESLKKLASIWYDAKRADVSGFYAQEIANILNDEESWSIAGTTFIIYDNFTKITKATLFKRKKAKTQ